MAFDGITISNIIHELNNTITGGRIYKISQPETDEILLTVKTSLGQYRLVLSANASLPLAYLTEENKPAPATAPNFCMLLRKHLGNGRIIAITQPGFERIIDIEVEHLNELGDLCRKHIIAEFMGKHSNIILCDDNSTILDSIKHISAQTSSVREVLPGRPYFIPNTANKLNPLEADKAHFYDTVCTKPVPVTKALLSSYTGISTCLAEEIAFRAGIDGSHPANCLEEAQKSAIFNVFSDIFECIRKGQFEPEMITENDIPVEFASVRLNMYDNDNHIPYNSVSRLIIDYYRQKEIATRIHQKSVDIRRIVTTHLERAYKKLDIQEKQIKDTDKKDKYRIYGELLTTYAYSIPDGSREYEALNYYDNTTIIIPLDPSLSPIENANKYFARYNKLKRTYEAGIRLIQEITEEISYLESIINAIEISITEADLANIKEELIETGYVRRTVKGKSKKTANKPLHYISSDGFDIYVGKNNIQNDELTFKTGNGSDWWFHAKQMPGSHVLLKTEGKDVPDRTFEEAASLAAYYSKGRSQDKVEVDYVLKKEVKKPAGAKPGFVVYYTNYSMVADTDIHGIREV